MNLFYKLVWYIVHYFMVVFCRLEVVDADNIPEEGGVILASNHISAIDPPLMGISVRRTAYFMAKKELFNIFIIGFIIKNLNAIPVNRGIFDKNALKNSEEILENGFALIMFPEGTRSRTGELGKGKPGIGLLARTAVVPIVPIYIQNSQEFYKLLLTGRRLTIRYGKPITKDWVKSVADDKDGYRTIAGEVMERIAKLKLESEKNGHFS